MSRASRPELMAEIGAEARQFQLLFALCFLGFLAVATVARCVGWRWRPWPPAPGGYKSVFAEARNAANAYLPFAFLN